MKKIFNIALISLLISFGANQTFAQVLTADQFKSIVAKQAKKDLEQFNVDESEITVGHLPVSSFNLPDGKVSVKIFSNTNSLTAKEYKKVNINVNGNYVRTYYVPIETKAYKYAAIAQEVIQRDKIIPLQAVELKKVNVVGNLDNTLNLNDISKEIVATKVFYPGDLITKRYTKSKPDIVKNAMVTVNFRTGSNLNIAVEGIALTQGNIGDTIQVKNKRFNKLYTGEVTGINQVLVQI